MNATMIKGERSKLLAVVAIMAMVVCAFALAMPAADADGITVPEGTATELPKALDDGTIVLTEDVYLDATPETTGGSYSLAGIAKIDLAGHTLYTETLDVTGSTLTITDSGKNGKIVKVEGTDASSAIQIGQDGILTIEGIEIDASNGLWYGVYAMTGSNVTINDTKITAKVSCVSGNGLNNNANITLDNVNCTSEMTAAVFFPSTAKLTVTGGTFTGASGFDIRAGTVSITGATINIVLTNPDWTGTSGPSAFGMGVAVFDHKSYGDVIDVTVSGCTINDAVYDYYVGGLNLADGNANMDSSTAGHGPEGFNDSSLGEKYTYTDTITLKIPGYSFSSTYGYQFVANDVTGTSFTVPEGIVINGTVSFVDGETFTVSNVKAAGEDGLTISYGSIVLTGEMTAAEAQEQIDVAVATGKTHIKLDGLTITSGTLALDGNVSITGAVSVADGAGLDLRNATIDATSDGSIVNKGTVTGGEKIPSSVTVDNDGIMTSQGTDSQVAEAGSWKALNTILTGTTYYYVTTVILTNEIVVDGNFYANGRGVTLYTDGNDLTLNGTTNLTNLHIQVDDGSTITLGSSSITKYVSEESFIVMSGAIFAKTDGALLGTGDIPGSGSSDSKGDITYPYLNDGSYVLYKGNLYKVNHFKSGDIYIQYGVSGGNVEYTKNEIIVDQVPLLVQPFDNNVFNATGNPSYSLTTPDDEKYVDAKTYTDAIAFRITFLDPNQVTGSGSVTVNGYADLIIQPVDPTRYDVQIEGWEYKDEPNAPTYTYSDIDDNDMPSGNVSYTYEMLVEGIWTPVTTDPSEFGVGTYRVIATFKPVNSNYNEVTDTCEFKVTPTTLDISFGTVDNNDNDMFWGTDPDRYMNFPYEVNKDNEAEKITISGGVYYINDINDIEGITTESGKIYEGDMAKGYYALLNIVNNNDFPLKMTIGSREYTIGADNGTDDNTKQMIFWLGSDLGNVANKEIVIEPIGNSDYEGEKYTLIFDVYRMTTSGYEANGTDAVDGIAAEGFVRADASVGDVMWIAYDGAEVAGEKPYGYLYYDGKLVYVDEDMTVTENEYTTAGDSGRIWYFSFAADQGVEAWLDENLVEGYEPGQPGKYTMYISLTEPKDFDPETSKYVTSAVEYIEGYVDSGFSHYADSALKDLQELYKAYGVEYPRTDIVDNTMWFAWYQEGYEGQEIKAYVSTVENNFTTVEYLWINGDPMYDEDGLRGFAWSFDNNEQGAKYVDGLVLPETVYVLITATDSEGTVTTVATGTIDLKFESSSVDIDSGMDLSDILGKKPLDFMDITVSQNGTTISIRGDVYLIDSWEDYCAGVDTEGYYIALTVDPSVESEYFDWSQANVTLYNPYNPLLEEKGYTKTFEGTFDGQLLLYIGKDLDALTAENAQGITLKIDLDGAEPFLTETTYTLDISGLEQGVRTYTVTYVDPDYPLTEGGYNVTEYIAGNILTLPTVPDISKEALGWKVDDTGVIYNCGTRVDLSQLDTDGDYNITFYAQYGSSSGGDVSGSDARQLEDYYIEAEFTDAGLVISIKTDKTDGFRNVLTTIDIDWFDWDTETGDHITRYINEPKDGVVISYTIPGITYGTYDITVTGLVGTSWLAIGDPDLQGMISVSKEAPDTPLLKDDFDGEGNPMTFTVIEEPEDAPAENNYPWLQIDYERLQNVDSVTLKVNGETVSFNWVDYDTGEAIETPESIPAGKAYFQFSYADGDVDAGASTTFTIIVTSGDVTDSITMTIDVPNPAPESA